MTESIIRTPTEIERKDFTPILGVPKGRDARKNFIDECARQQQKASKEKLPFADFAAMNDFDDYYKIEKQKNIRKNGYLKLKEIKPLTIDWTKYSDIKNFNKIDEGETMDASLSKNNNVTVSLKWTKYQYKGYKHPITVMEEPLKAVARAKEAAGK